MQSGKLAYLAPYKLLSHLTSSDKLHIVGDPKF